MHIDDEPHDQEDINALLRHLDHPAPPVSVDAVIARARTRTLGWGKWAAGVLLVAGLGGVAYAIPGSPVPGWIAAVVNGIAGTNTAPATQDPATTRPGPDAGAAGIAVEPGSDFRILFSQPVDSGQARITLTGGTDVIVRAPAGAATFTSDVSRLVIDNTPTAAVFEISIPQSAPRVEIQVRGRRVFLKDGARVIADSMTVSNDQYVIPLGP